MAKPPRRSLSDMMEAEAASPAPLTPSDAGHQQEEITRSVSVPTKRAREIVQQTAYLPSAVHRQLRELAFSEEKKMHDFLMEGLDLVFQKRGLPSIQEIAGRK